MKKEKVHLITIVGARPQFVKAAALNRVLRGDPCISEKILHTGQHYDYEMNDAFFSELGIAAPAWNLEIGSGPHGHQTGRMLMDIEAVLARERPDMVLVYGDTNSTMAGALAASKMHIPVAHVEAGLRSSNLKMPEEVNRRVTDAVSDLLLAPTTVAVRNLQKEGIPGSKIRQVGDVMYDVALALSRAVDGRDTLKPLGLEDGSYALATIHRAENTSDRHALSSILQFFERIANSGMDLVFPVHPRTKPFVDDYFRGKSVPPRLRLLPPVGPLDMVRLEKGARVIVTDSGGLQREAYFHKVPCVIARAETEWVELVESGWSVLAPPGDSERMYAIFLEALKRTDRSYELFYGAGDTAEKIAAELKAFFD